SNPARITEAMYRDYLDALGRGWVAEQDGEIIGFAYADRTDASIWALFVDPAREGVGAGKRLLRLAVDWLFEIGNDEVRLGTAAGTRADRFYAAEGWTREDRRTISRSGTGCAGRTGTHARRPEPVQPNGGDDFLGGHELRGLAPPRIAPTRRR
ncbi:MAG: GNAT family N-acetyltransferase, partial [Pseudomonadota bacterium]|nr:GNAT family N-acetyltransferase [Pseudomonadota bacterium]